MPKHPTEPTLLSYWRISEHEELRIELIRPRFAAIERTLKPSIVRIHWPSQPSDIYSQQFPAAAGEGAATFAEAATVLTQIKARMGWNL